MKRITSYFKPFTPDEEEVYELKQTQSARHSMADSLQTAQSISTISTLIFDKVIDLTNNQPAQANFDSDGGIIIIDDDDDEQHQEEAAVPSHNKSIIPSVGDSVFTAFDAVIGPELLVFSTLQPTCNKPIGREYTQRPDNWSEIASYYNDHRKVDGTIFRFKLNSDKVKSKMHWRTTLLRWVRDLKNPNFKLQYGRIPVYGNKIDIQLVRMVEHYNEHAVPMSNMILRMQLVQMLKVDQREDILDAIAEGDEPFSKTKKYRFTDQWALRFYKRNNLSTRVATTKMRDELPAQYEEKVQSFKYILSLNINDHQVPDALILNMDETNTMFVPQIPRTRCKKGTRRVRLVGVGKDKAQVTTTPTVNAEGDVVVPTQVIFGGKTKRCHPNGGKPPFPKDIYFENSPSHWQTPETMIRYVNKVLIPYRIATIARLNLAADQKMILILDLHYSHKDSVVLAHLRENHILPVFIPAGCTDLHQVCDVVVNKPYKNGVVQSFVDYVTEKFCVFNQRANPEPVDVFQLNMAGSVMKPLIPGYVERGMAAVGKPSMKEAIKQCFYTASFVGEARQLETYELAKLKYPTPVEEIPVPEEREVEEDLGPIADDSPINGAADGEGVFDVHIGDAEDPTELTEETGPEEVESAEVEDEQTTADVPKKKRQKRKSVPPAVNSSAGNNINFKIWTRGQSQYNAWNNTTQ